MRLSLCYVMFVTSLPLAATLTTITIFELGAKFVKLSQSLLGILATINEHELLVGRERSREEMIFFSGLDDIYIRVGEIREQLHGIGHDLNAIVQLLHNLPDTIRFELHLHDIRTAQVYVDIYYETLGKYVRDFEDYKHSTLIEFANNVVAEKPNSVSQLIKLVDKQVTGKDFLEFFYKYFQPTPESYFCKAKQSSPQMIHNFMNEIIMIDIKGYFLIQTAYMIKKMCRTGNFTREIQATHEEFQENINDLIATMKPYMAKGSSELWRCDPEKHVKDETYVEVTNFLHGIILNKVNLDPNGRCREQCDVYKYTLDNQIKCRNNDWCKKQVRCSKIVNCYYVDSSMRVCPTSMTKHNRRYEYIEFTDGRTLGKKEACKEQVRDLKTYRDWVVWRCSYCFCLCDEGSKYFSDRYVNLVGAMSNIAENKVVTGVRFVKRKQIIYLQVQEGKLLSHGQIDLDTIRWVPLTEYERTDKNSRAYYHTLSWEERSFDLADILVDDGYVLTGVKFTKVGTRLHLEIVQTSIDFTTGLLNKTGSNLKEAPDLQIKRISGKELKLVEPDVSIRSESGSTEFTTNKYVQITHSDFVKDAGQTAVPFFDAQPVESATPVPLQGVGIFHKGRRGYGGFIAPRIFTYNFTQHLEPVFPTQKNREV